jgi:hypothetical protein
MSRLGHRGAFCWEDSSWAPGWNASRSRICAGEPMDGEPLGGLSSRVRVAVRRLTFSGQGVGRAGFAAGKPSITPAPVHPLSHRIQLVIEHGGS